MLKTHLAQSAAQLNRESDSSNNAVRKDHMPNLRSPWIRASELPELFRSWDLAYRCTRNGWLKPIVHGKRRTIYRLADVLACMQRIEAGELPVPRRSKAAE
jgi:hypothetical protein